VLPLADTLHEVSCIVDCVGSSNMLPVLCTSEGSISQINYGICPQNLAWQLLCR